jgi:hypothetical protein
MRGSLLAIARSLWLLAGSAGIANAEPATGPQTVLLDNGVVRLKITPALGGRVLEAGLSGLPSMLKIGPAVQWQAEPEVSADADDIAYLGHDVWVGPQSQWWAQQQQNPARRQAAANWPPDPYLSLATTTVLHRDQQRLELLGVQSPISGLRLHKHFELSAQRADTVQLRVSARNVREQPVAWDLWFNTRVHASARVFVPVAAASDIRQQPAPQDTAAAPTYRLEQGLLQLAASNTAGQPRQRGKLLLQPSAGWIAGFDRGQMLLIRFDRQPRRNIHPEQGQVELYLDSEAGLLELEVHARYRHLVSGQQMWSGEQWTLLRYNGPDEALAQRQFLCAQARQLGLAHACPY